MGKERVDTGRGRRQGVVKGARKSPASLFYIVIAVIAVGGIAALTYISTRNSAQTVSPIDPTLPPVRSEGYVLGSPQAPVEVVEFADFECPACAQFAAVTEPDVRSRLVNTGQIRVRFVDFPLSMHRNTWNASRAAACADEQGQFWAMHDVIYANQDRWNGEATSNPDKVLKELARSVAMDQGKFESCVESKRTQAKIQAHLAIAEQRQIQQTPSFIIGSQMAPGALTYDHFKQLVDQAIASAGPRAPAAAIGGDSAARAPAAGGATKR